MASRIDQDDSRQLAEQIEAYAHRKVIRAVPVIDNAQNYAAINPGMVLRLVTGDYYILGEAKEGRFGIDDQPKMWVKYAIDLTDGARKIIKLPFLEQFEINVGPFKLRCVRNPDKESRVLEAVAGDERFMQGMTVHDRLGNNIRIIEQIRGSSLYRRIADLDMPHQVYYRFHLADYLGHVLGCLDGLAALHARGQQHGDVRNDHLWYDADRLRYRWIDFDYEANYLDYDVWSVGNVLNFVIGQGSHTCRDASRSICVDPDDAMVFFTHRLANLRALFPYISPELNEILMRFSLEATEFYESVADIVADLRRAIPTLGA